MTAGNGTVASAAMRSPAGESASKSSTQAKALTRYVTPSAASGEAADDSFFAQIWYITSATTIRTTGHHRASMKILLSKKKAFQPHSPGCAVPTENG